MNCLAGTSWLKVTTVSNRTGRRDSRISRRLWAAPVLLCTTVALSACGEMGRLQTASLRPAPAAKPAVAARTVAPSAASEREHERILAAYGGVYDDPKLQAMIT